MLEKFENTAITGDFGFVFKVILQLKNPPYTSNETWYAIVTIKGDVKTVIKRGDHPACFHATVLTNMVI